MMSHQWMMLYDDVSGDDDVWMYEMVMRVSSVDDAV